MCQHQPACPDAKAPDGSAAHVVASHPEQGWSLGNGGEDDCDEVLPDAVVGVVDPGGPAVPSGRRCSPAWLAAQPSRRVRACCRPCQDASCRRCNRSP